MAMDMYLSNYSNKGWSAIFLIPILFSTVHCFLGTGHIEYKPTEYTVESTSFKVFVKTPDALYESERKIDFDEWTQNKPGFIEEHHNHFNMIFRTRFTVNKLETK